MPHSKRQVDRVAQVEHTSRAERLTPWASVLERRVGLDERRQPRLVADGLVYHARNRGNNRPAVLSDDADRAAFLQALGQAEHHFQTLLHGAFTTRL